MSISQIFNGELIISALNFRPLNHCYPCHPPDKGHGVMTAESWRAALITVEFNFYEVNMCQRNKNLRSNSLKICTGILYFSLVFSLIYFSFHLWYKGCEYEIEVHLKLYNALWRISSLTFLIFSNNSIRIV